MLSHSLHAANVRPVLVVNSLGLRLPTPGTSTHAGRRVLRKARSMAKMVRRPVPDLPDDGFRRMLCIEAAVARQPARLPAGGSWWGRQTLVAL